VYVPQRLQVLQPYILCQAQSSVTRRLTGVRSISYAVVWFFLTREEEDLSLSFLIQ
jgi:hypothetical protein